MKVTTIKGSISIGGTYQNLWCFTWNTKKEYNKYINLAEDQFKGYFLKIETEKF